MSKETDEGIVILEPVPEEISLEEAVAAKNIKAINDLIPDISCITPGLLRDAVQAQDLQVIEALLKNVSKEEFIGKPELMKELIDINTPANIKYILSGILKMEARDINQCRITASGSPEGGYTLFEYAMLNKSSDPEKYLPHIESAFELMDLGANAAIREGVDININKIIASQRPETNGHTPLTYCISRGSTTAVRALVDEAGANPNMQSKEYGLPLSTVLGNLSMEINVNDKEQMAQTMASQIAHTLISRGADINQELISTSKVKTPEYVRLETEAQKLRGEIEGYEAAQKRIIGPKEKELIRLGEKDLREAEKELAKASELEKSEAQRKVDGIKGEIQQIKEEIKSLKQSEKFLDLEAQITRTKGSLKDNLRSTQVLRQEGRDFNITETRTTIVDNLKRNRPRGSQKDPVFVLCDMLSDFQTKKKALDEQLKIVEESASKISSSSPFKVVKAHRHLCKAAARTSEKLLDEMLKESRVHLEPLLEKVQKIKREADRAKELREEIGHVVGLGGRIMNKSITPEVAARARGIGDSIIPTTRPRSPITPPRISEKPTSSLKR
jgi:hypothetical protein